MKQKQAAFAQHMASSIGEDLSDSDEDGGGGGGGGGGVGGDGGGDGDGNGVYGAMATDGTDAGCVGGVGGVGGDQRTPPSSPFRGSAGAGAGMAPHSPAKIAALSLERTPECVICHTKGECGRC